MRSPGQGQQQARERWALGPGRDFPWPGAVAGIPALAPGQRCGPSLALAAPQPRARLTPSPRLFLERPGAGPGRAGRLRTEGRLPGSHGLGPPFPPFASWAQARGGQGHAHPAPQPLALLPAPRPGRLCGGALSLVLLLPLGAWGLVPVPMALLRARCTGRPGWHVGGAGGGKSPCDITCLGRPLPLLAPPRPRPRPLWQVNLWPLQLAGLAGSPH